MQSSNVRLMPRKALVGQSLRSTCTNGTRCRAFFNFGNKGNNAQTPVKTRGDFTEVEVSDYFEYTGMLAEEGNYDRMDAMLASKLSSIIYVYIYMYAILHNDKMHS